MMNELGAKALEWLRERPNVMGMSDAELVVWCERTGQEMEVEAARLTESVFQRMEVEARESAGKVPSDGEVQAAMWRTARATAVRIVMQERVWDLAAVPMSRRIGDWVDEDLPELEMGWDPDWMVAMESTWVPGPLDYPEDWPEVDPADPYTWTAMAEGFPTPCLFWSSGELNEALAAGRLVWGPGDTLVPKVKVDRLAREAEARGEPAPGIPRGV